MQGTDGAAIDKGIDIPHAELIIRKGYHPQVDSYSAFIEADQHTRTGLDGYLKGRSIRTVYVVGLATDFCVAWTAIDARKPTSTPTSSRTPAGALIRMVRSPLLGSPWPRLA